MKKKYKWMIVVGILLVIAGAGIIIQDKTNRQKKGENTEQSQKEDASNTTDKEKTDNVPEDKWPYGNERYMDYDEPVRVREFHNNKKYYDAVVEQFIPYAGKDIAFYTTKMFPIELNNPNTEDGSVKVTSYDADTFKALMKYTSVGGIYAAGDYIDFHFETSDEEGIWYFYDENVSEETSEYINHYYMVNIAPHWWWVEYGAGT